MTNECVYIDGELYLSIEVVADIYSIQAPWLREACDYGLIAPTAPHGSSLCIAAFQLDRVATIVRLRASLGPGLQRIADELAELERDS